MNNSRRRWFQRIASLGIVAWFVPRTAIAQSRPPVCSGYVRDLQGNGIVGLVVEIIEPNGGVTSSTTKQGGRYDMPAPPKGPYVLQFVDAKFNTRLFDVRELTEASQQDLSVTIDVQRRTFMSNYDALQAIETLLAWMIADRTGEASNKLRAKYPLNALSEVVDRIGRELSESEPTERQRSALEQKILSIRTLMKLNG